MRIRDHIALMLPERLSVRVEDALNNVIRRWFCTRELTLPYRLYSDVSKLIREYEAQFARDASVLNKHDSFAAEYINVLVESGKLPRAKQIFQLLEPDKRTYLAAHYFRIAELAKVMGSPSCDEVRIADVFTRLANNHVSDCLYKFFADKTVAVVGNGPSEVGKGLGGEIDGHDIVVRINNYAVDGYEKDYGARTDVWVKASLDYLRHEIRDTHIRVILYESNLERFPLVEGYVDAIEKELGSIFVDYCGQDDHAFFCDKYYRYPTTGLMIVHKLIHMPIKSLDVYGFSFLQDKVDRTGSFAHYSKADAIETRLLNRRWHHMDCELQLFNKWFPGKQRRFLP